MDSFKLTVQFDSEQSCRLHFKNKRDKIGVKCQRCGCEDHYWIKAVWSYECKSCRARTSLRSGTIMQSSNLSFLAWYKTIFLMTLKEKGFSIKEIQKQIGLKRYEPVWSMINKLRKITDTNYCTLENFLNTNEENSDINLEIPKKINISPDLTTIKQTIENLSITTSLIDQKKLSKENIFPYFTLTKTNNYTSNLGQEKNILNRKNNTYIDITNLIEVFLPQTDNSMEKEYLNSYLSQLTCKLNQIFSEEQLFNNLLNHCFCKTENI